MMATLSLNLMTGAVSLEIPPQSLRISQRCITFVLTGAIQGVHVFVNNESHECTSEIDLLKDVPWKPSKDDLPPIINLPGLSLDTQSQLYTI